MPDASFAALRRSHYAFPGDGSDPHESTDVGTVLTPDYEGVLTEVDRGRGRGGAQRQALAVEGGMTDFERLVRTFPSLARAPIEPWDATRFLRWLCTTGLSHGELLAARFVLGVWNPETDWVAEARKDGRAAPESAKRFDLLEAAAVWDRAHLEAVRSWLARPLFP